MRLMLIIAFLFISSDAFAHIIGVPGNAPSIQAGIDASSPGDTVLVQPGRYLETIDFKGKDIVVGSLFLATRDSSYILNTIIDAKGNNTVVTFQTGESAAAELCGFTITNGLSKGSIFHSEFNPGGGICCKNASPYLHHLIVEGNRSLLDGGGMYLENSNSLIENCMIRNNTAGGSGGGVAIYHGNHKINNSVMSNNAQGAIAVLDSSTVRCYSLLLAHNSSVGLITSLSNLDIVNCTITNHVNDTFEISGSNVNIINSIFWNVDYPEVAEIVIADNYPLYPISQVTIAYSDINDGKNRIAIRSVNKGQLIWKEGNIDNIPNFIFDYSLNSLSPCIDAGTPFYQVNDSIIINLNKYEYHGLAPDMGAFESNYTSTIVNENNTFNMSLSNYPNPFNSTTTIHYSLSKPGHVRLAIYTITGQKIIDLLDKSLPVGNYQIQWNGIETSGKKISSGVYIIRLNTGIQSLSKRLVYLK